MEQRRSITESPNSLSGDIDLATPEAIARILRQTDAQVFAGYLDYPGLYDSATLDTLQELAKRAADTLSDPKGMIALSGAGTSGRLAMFGARIFNHQLAALDRAPFRFLIAGAEPALIQAQEGAEDSPTQAKADLRPILEQASNLFYVGVTCGLSAPYIAGQIEELLPRDNCFSVLMGFNPLELARDTPIESWPFTFQQTAAKVACAENAALLNPVVGPEPVTGSTRMKSGTATKVLIEVLFHTAIQEMNRTRRPASLRGLVGELLEAYEQAYRRAYEALDNIGQLVELGGTALRSKAHIYYLGGSGQASQHGTDEPDAGILGLIDASECPPTFGASFEDVRGFLAGGWKALFPDGRADLSSRGGHYRIGIDDFRRDKLPELSQNDLCVFLGEFSGSRELLGDVKKAGAKTAAVAWQKNALKADVVVPLDVKPHKVLGVGPLEMAIKLVLNALTTGAHILAGKVFGNRMVDLRISNNKLFHRTTGIISDLIKVSNEQAIDALLRAVYRTDALTDSQRESPISECIETAKSVEKVVPKALLLATGKFTNATAAEALARNPVIRAVIEQHIK